MKRIKIFLPCNVMDIEPKARLFLQLAGTNIACHDDNRISEINFTAFCVAQVTIFKDLKQHIERFSEAYESAFQGIKDQAKVYEGRLTSLKDQIETINKDLEAEHKRLEEEANSLQGDRNSVDPDHFNNRVDAYNADVSTYNRQVSQVADMVDSYNEMYQKYKELMVEQQDLFKAIDSRPQQISN